MQFLVLARRRTEAFAAEAFDPHLEAEAERARELYAEGYFRQMWSREDLAGAIIVLEAVDLAAAQAVVATLPLVAKNMLEVQIIPLRGYRGFGPRGPK